VRLLLIATSLVVAAGCASFEPIDEAKLSDPGVLGDADVALPDRETCVFRGVMSGIPAGRGIFRFQRRDGVYETEADVETVGLVSLIYGMALRCTAVSDDEDLLSLRWGFTTEEGDGKRVEVRFQPERDRAISVIRNGDEVKTSKPEAPGMLDPLGAIYALRRTRLELGRSFRLNLFTEWFVYCAKVLVAARERIRVPAGEFDAILVRVDISRSKDGEPSEAARAAGLWLTDDDRRIPVRIEADSKLGRLTLDLERHQPGWPRVMAGRGTE
jgi:hypothetical protein